ncbi:FAD-dependent tricarballylate dehydrogenase TcuA [Streptomyces profundus]|uniref:FAD-dependent tricarballylate dehydrogenase TcuA n=1 Tax=Streptomyces profundus TaxID=2867410 RepID=UPI001D16A768|nr:FAD-dependent tricarballylate dehydrogenase TcuA [Streptomyces sp. MA3_2.13]UED84686.1 FAD-dependent tricarballylate dehydrogenase TcuA [Streptomyces sp. MA3_2.13]
MKESTGHSGPDAEVDVIVVGAGNAGLCAAHAAREKGASVVVLEKAAAETAGGNTYYTAGAFRVPHGGRDDLLPLVDEESRARAPRTVLPPYTTDEFHRDLARLTDGRNDPELSAALVEGSKDILAWLARHGIRWQLLYDRQTYLRDGQWVFFGGLNVGTVDGGKGLIAQHTGAATASGVAIEYEARVVDLLREGEAVTGVVYTDAEGAERRLRARSVVLAAGGFQASVERRVRYLGEKWSHALLRGNPASTGEILDLALAAGAAPYGDWSTCHSVQWDAGAASEGGERELTNQLTRQSYPVGIVVNAEGRRFIDEGADFRNYTYAKYGREVLEQPGHIAFQIFDSKSRPLLRTLEYDSSPITEFVADSLEELATAMGIDPKGLREETERFNEAIDTSRPFDPSVKDERRADVIPPKSHWALELNSPPFYGYPVRCGITFTFGGLRIDPDSARVLTEEAAVIPGLFAAGELVGGVFWGNYPGGSGLTLGSVFGRRAGYAAAGS